ncbi:bifunctional 4-hydroxy-2-oxoglutarate aldolase/2-dehydro-3-deoxy-phosphogluconate aldolase [Brachybacterium sp. NBEC-018]|uniref:bifunctional 4-hydroxy-2-oxoglutarate aldolase/2-dehydro-3-deoxy-phosphogluconate aldolase n=1 Tax=Brachybacterium sp. NBEC-018 TaxID=2996004 RepID=UPI0021756AA9|nr:bifunctional 4-hydroxy-2-oxoglutarate aldolase/2-dehydro-3-deoxy-phosphogluconate aldolase [Brachybacterium sp. NBEC-018]UVY84052.1 bifunctional 4-hydroxy-2-oxoglutarate aldolase/2-dehydro-3-deoxy-phosphogluconate aldolase [Brachybacterium sp. NBEC-018]
MSSTAAPQPTTSAAPASTASTSAAWFDAAFDGQPLMAILRGTGVERSLELARTAWDLGIDAVEIPLQSATDLEALTAVVREGRERGKEVGAGTVLDAATVGAAAQAGAAFTVSPGLDLDVVRASEAAGMPSLPGVATATEVQRAYVAGLRWLKAFPASLLGESWFGAMRGPFPEARFVATGGMNARNATAYLDAGVRVVAVGSALEDRAELDRLAEVIAR